MLIAVHLVIAAHVAHWLIAGRTVTPVEPSEAMAYSKAGIVNAGLIFFAATILVTAVFGRFFCGWACHLVALQDLCLWLLQKAGIRPMPLRSRLLRLVPFAAFFYMFLWPLVYRLWIGDRFDRFGTEFTTTEFWATFPGWIVGGLTFLVRGFATVYFLGAKGFCTYACPYGAIFAAADRVAPMRIRVTDACSGCGHCTAVCTSNVRVHQEVRDYGMVVDSGCMKCRVYDEQTLVELLRDRNDLGEHLVSFSTEDLDDLLVGPEFEPEEADDQPRLDAPGHHPGEGGAAPTRPLQPTAADA